MRRVVTVVGSLLALCVLGSLTAMTQGPRLTAVGVNPTAAIEASGTRVTLTTNQALDPIDPGQVQVTPAADFTLDVQGRNIGLRFTTPLDDATTYTVTVSDLTSVGGGRSASVEAQFATPRADVFLLQRGEVGARDAIVNMPVDGMSRTTVFTHDHIEEFRVAPASLVIAVEEEGESAIIVTDRDGTNPRYARLPADGHVTSLQVSNRGASFGYLFTDRELSATSGRASVLYTASLLDPDAAPKELKLTGEDTSVADWMFVPDSTGILIVTFSGDLLLTEGGDPALLGTAYAIDGISRGTYEAIINRSGVPVGVDLRTGREIAVEFGPLTGTPGRVEPATDGARLWAVTQRDEAGMPTGSSVELVKEGEARVIASTPKEEPILQFCVSPSGQYIALTTAPHYATNPYDLYSRPMPKTLTRIVAVSDGHIVSELDGFDISWCSRSQL